MPSHVPHDASTNPRQPEIGGPASRLQWVGLFLAPLVFALHLVANSLSLKLPNGIAWDSTGNRWIVVSFHRFGGEVAAMPATRDSSRQVLRHGRGQLDGVEILSDGAIMFSSWADSAIHILRESRDVKIIREVPEPADIGFDPRRRRVLIPLTVAGQVQVWELP